MLSRVALQLEYGPSPDDPYEFADANFEYPMVIGNEEVSIDGLWGIFSDGFEGIANGEEQKRRIDELAQKIQESGRIDRLLVDGDGNVIEGQHRLMALKQLGVTEVPISRIIDLETKVPIEKMKMALEEQGGLHPQQIRQVVTDAAEFIVNEGLESVSEYEWHPAFETAFEVVREDGVYE